MQETMNLWDDPAILAAVGETLIEKVGAAKNRRRMRHLINIGDLYFNPDNITCVQKIGPCLTRIHLLDGNSWEVDLRTKSVAKRIDRVCSSKGGVR